MFYYSYRIKLAGPDTKSVAWAQTATETINRLTGARFSLSTRIGGALELLWAAEFETLQGLLDAQAKIAADAGYQTSIAAAVSDAMFIPGSAETAIWVAA